MTNINTINDIVNLNKTNGGTFFDADIVRYWRSRFNNVYPGGVFITSERNASDKRMYSVRRIDGKGDIETLFFQECDTLAKAKSLAKRYCKDNGLTEYKV